MKRTKVAIYTRTSTADRQDPTMQSRELETYCELRGWETYRIYEDKGYTGTNTNRPELKALFKDAQARKFDLLLVWKLDRFGRSLREIVQMLQTLSDYGVEFCSLKDSLDLSSSQGKLMFHIIAAFSQYEADVIKTRVRAGLENARAKGKILGRRKERDDDAIRDLHAKGLSQRVIAGKLKVSKGSVQNALRGWTTIPSKNPRKKAL